MLQLTLLKKCAFDKRIRVQIKGGDNQFHQLLYLCGGDYRGYVHTLPVYW